MNSGRRNQTNFRELKTRVGRKPARVGSAPYADASPAGKAAALLFQEAKCFPEDEDSSGDEAQKSMRPGAADEAVKSEEEEEPEDSSDDEEELARELEAIKREKAEAATAAAAAAASDRSRPPPSSGDTVNRGAPRDWTEESVFNVRHVTVPDEYVNDTLRSSFHKRFLERHIH